MEIDAWARYDVSSWRVRGVEQAGSTRNLWLEEPGTGREWLHKETKVPANGVEQGEDWSEVVSTQVATLLGVPCAETRLCFRNGRRGSLSLSVMLRGHSLWEGRTVMERAQAPGYFPHVEGMPGVDPTRPGLKRPGHSLGNIRTALKHIGAPPGFDGPVELSGFDVFAGYTILDALIANRDRHEQNWAVLTAQLLSSPEQLAPSYDHATSLGYNLLDAKRQAYVADHSRLVAWAEGGTAHRFEHEGTPPTLVEHAANAVALCSRSAADWWRDRLASVELEPVLQALRDRVIIEMSDPAATFAHDLLELNLRRLRDAICQRA